MEQGAMSEPAFLLKHGAEYPYDAPDSWWNQDGETREPPPPVDWAHRAARGILASMTDRCGIKHGFDDIDEDVRAEIVQAVAEVIRAAARGAEQ